MKSLPGLVSLGMLLLAASGFTTPLSADDVTLSGVSTFASVDGSAQDHDGLANGVFTVDDGNLVIDGTVNCNDPATPGQANACAMRFAVSGDLTIEAGGVLMAENQVGKGNGGNITLEVGGSLFLRGATPGLPGALVSSSRFPGTDGTAGKLTFTAGGDVVLEKGSILDAGTHGGTAGAISITADGAIEAAGLVASGPSRTLLATRLTGKVLNGGNSNQKGGAISLRSKSLRVEAEGVVASQGEKPGAGTVLLEACGVEVRGLVASVSVVNGPTQVLVRSGEGILIDGRDLGAADLSLVRRGRVRSNAIRSSGPSNGVDLFARGAIEVHGPEAPATLFAVTSRLGASSTTLPGGLIRAYSLDATLTATGNAFETGSPTAGNRGGVIDLQTRGNAQLDEATLRAVGGGPGGMIAVRSFQGDVSWMFGVGDVRRTGSSVVPASARGLIQLKACLSVDVTGTQFPTNGSPVPPFPVITEGVCSPTAPALPAGQPPLPTCDLPPTAVADSATVDEDAPATTIDVLANDTDPDGGPKSIASVTQPANGTVVITNSGAHLTYQPAPDYCNSQVGGLPDTFNYTLTPGSSSTTVSVTVTCADDNPVAVDDTATVAEDAAATTIDVLANDTDGDAGSKTIASVTQPANGTVVITNSGADLTYQPNPNYCNSQAGGVPDTFTYTLSPGSSSATVSVTVTCAEDNPVAVADAATVTEDAPATPVDVLANDTDPDGGAKSIASVTQPANGTVVITGGGSGLTYQPNPNYCNSQVGGVPDTFTYTLAPGGSSTTVSMTVTCVDDNPVAVADAATVLEDAAATAVDVLANDTDIDGGPKSVASVTQPANGTVVITGGGTGLTYQPNANYCNSQVGGVPDTFTYTLSPGGSSTTVSMTVTCVDDDPVAVADAATVAEDSAATAVDVLANDTDVDAGPKSVASVTQPANGAVVITGGGTGLTYQPNPNYCNSQAGGVPDTFTYTLSPGGSSTTVSMTVTCIDDNPVAVADAANVLEDAAATAIDVLANDTDVDAGPKSVASVTQPANGTVVNNGTNVTYQPAPNYCNSVSGIPDTFTYTLNPGGSSTTVSVTVTCVDDPPTAVADAASTLEDAAATAIDVLANDTDTDGGPKSVASVVQPANGTVVITGGGTGLTYQPNPNYCNTQAGGLPDTFTYTLSPGGSSTTVSVQVICVNDPPQLTDATPNYTAIGNTQLQVSEPTDPPVAVAFSTDPLEVRAAGKAGPITDVDGPGPIEVVPASGPTTAGGTFAIEADGDFTYHPPANFTGTDTFAIQITDNGDPAATATATVTIAVSEMVWYVQNDTATAGTAGTSVDPVDTLAEAGSLSGVNHYIYVFEGDGTNDGQDAGITLKNGQKLLGQGVDLVVASQTLVTGSLDDRPLVTNAAGNAVTVLANTANGNRTGIQIRGLRLASTGAGANAIDLTSADAAALEAEIAHNVITGSTAEGIDINAGSTSTNQTFSIHDNTVTAGLRGIDVNRTAGTATITSFARNVITGDTGGSGIEIVGVTFDSTLGLPINQVLGDTLAIGQAGNGVAANGLVLTGVTGDLSFNQINIFNDGGAGLRASSTGALNAAAGTGFRFIVNAAGPGSTIDSNGGPAVDVNGASLNLPLTILESTNSTTTGVSLVNAFGGVGSTTLSVGSGLVSDPVGASGIAFNISGGTGNISFPGPITNNSGNAVVVTGRSGDTVSFTGAVNETGSGISLTGNGGATISFTGGVTASTGTNPAFTATGGGTVSVTGSANTLATTTNTALNVANTNIGASGLTFRSISAGTAASGPVNGIVLNNTGASGGLTVAGTGGAGTGGTIQRTTGDSILLTNTRSVSLSSMNVQNSSESGILGTSVNGLNLTGCSFTSNGDDSADVGIKVNNLSGSAAFSSTSVTGSALANVFIDNTTGTLSSFTISGGSYSSLGTAFGSNSILLNIRGTSVLTIGSISGITLSNNKPARAITIQAQDTASIGDFTVQTSTFTNNGVQASFEQSGSANLSFKLLNNPTMTMTLPAPGTSHAVNVASSSTSTGGTIQGTIQGNTIGNAAVPSSGSPIGSGIRVFIQGRTQATLLIDSNVIRQVPQARGIDAQFLGPLSIQPLVQSDITVTNNNVIPNDSTGFPAAAIYLAADSQGGSPVRMRSDVRGNTVPAGAAVDSLPTFLIVDEVAAAAEAQLVDTAPASANCTAQLTSTNTGSSSAAAGCALIAGPISTP